MVTQWFGLEVNFIWGGLRDFKPGGRQDYVSRKAKGFKVTLEDDLELDIMQEQAIEVQLSH